MMKPLGEGKIAEVKCERYISHINIDWISNAAWMPDEQWKVTKQSLFLDSPDNGHNC